MQLSYWWFTEFETTGFITFCSWHRSIDGFPVHTQCCLWKIIVMHTKLLKLCRRCFWSLFFWTLWYGFTCLVQRIFHSTKTQSSSLTPDKLHAWRWPIIRLSFYADGRQIDNRISYWKDSAFDMLFLLCPSVCACIRDISE